MNERGFTLLEMLVVIALVAMLTVSARTLGKPMLDKVRVDYATKLVASQIEWAERNAILFGQPVAIRQAELGGDSAVHVTLFSPDGISKSTVLWAYPDRSVTSARIVLQLSGRRRSLQLTGLTGRLVEQNDDDQ